MDGAPGIWWLERTHISEIEMCDTGSQLEQDCHRARVSKKKKEFENAKFVKMHGLRTDVGGRVLKTNELDAKLVKRKDLALPSW